MKDSDVKNIRELPTGEVAVPKNCARGWAAKNAYTLIFLSVMFVITWVIVLVTGLLYGTPR